MRQLAGTKTRYRRAYAAPLAGRTSDRVENNAYPSFDCLRDLRALRGAICDLIFYHGEHREARNTGRRVTDGLSFNGPVQS